MEPFGWKSGALQASKIHRRRVYLCSVESHKGVQEIVALLAAAPKLRSNRGHGLRERLFYLSASEVGSISPLLC
jgi:hypothetical protein